MTDSARGAEKSKTTRTSPGAILYELENVAIEGRKLSFDVIKSLLAEKGIALKPAMYARYCLDAPLEKSLSTLLKAGGKQRLSEDKLAREIREGIELSLLDACAKPRLDFMSFARRAKGSGMVFGAMSGIGVQTARQLVGRLPAPTEPAPYLYVYAGESRAYPSSDSWIRLAQNAGIKPIRCLCLTTSAASCQSALGAGMRCAVLPDTFTEFQDYSGADLILHQVDEEACTNILALLESDS